MFPFLDLSIVKIPMYGFSIVIGILISYTMFCFSPIKKENKHEDFFIISAVVVLFGFIFAKLLFILVTYPIKDFFTILWYQILGIKNQSFATGFVFYGGLLGGIIGYILGVKIAKCHISDYLNSFGFIIPIIHGFGRFGCFCAGCCYGILYEGPFSVYYRTPLSDAPIGQGIFPVQLLESFILLLLGITLYIMNLKNKKNIFFIYLIFYSVIRFFIEFLRADYKRGFLWNLSTSQIISIVIFLFTTVLLVMKNKINKINKSE